MLSGAPERWQAQTKEGFAAADFKLNWTTKQAICPQGQSSKSWSETIEKGLHRVVMDLQQYSGDFLGGH